MLVHPLSTEVLRTDSTFETMAAFEAALSLYSLYSSKPLSFPKPSTSLNLRIANFVPISNNFLFSPPKPILTRKLSFELPCSAVQEITAQEEPLEQDSVEKTHQQQNLKRKLYVVNLPWSLTVVDIKNLFGQCGDVKDVEVILSCFSLHHFGVHVGFEIEFRVLDCLDYKATRWEEQRLCICHNGFWGRSSGCY